MVLPQASAEEQAYQPENIMLDVVYEDDDILVIHKPAGMVVHPAAGNWSGTVLNAYFITIQVSQRYHARALSIVWIRILQGY